MGPAAFRYGALIDHVVVIAQSQSMKPGVRVAGRIKGGALIKQPIRILVTRLVQIAAVRGALVGSRSAAAGHQ